MKNLTILTMLAAMALLITVPALVNAGCGACGTKAHSHAGNLGKSAKAAMPCGCPMSEEAMQMHKQMNMVQTAEHAGKFNTLMKAVRTAGLEETLTGAGPYTLFAPTDEAFANLPEGELDKLLKDNERLRAVLTYHVHPGLKTSSEFVKLTSLETVNGQKAKVAVEPCGVMIDHATVTRPDIECSNGVIHIIDKVILPEKMTS